MTSGTEEVSGSFLAAFRGFSCSALTSRRALCRGPGEGWGFCDRCRAPSLRSGCRVGADRHHGGCGWQKIKKKEPEKKTQPHAVPASGHLSESPGKRRVIREQPGQWKVKMLLGLRRCLPARGVSGCFCVGEIPLQRALCLHHQSWGGDATVIPAFLSPGAEMSPLGSLWARSELRLSHSAPSLPKPLQLDPCSPPQQMGELLCKPGNSPGSFATSPC